MSKSIVSTKGYLIDSACKYTSNVSLLDVDNCVYSCTLNQTDIKYNSNKFYIMQIIVTDTNFVMYVRYGRIGETGRSSYDSFNNKNDAIRDFQKKFKSKTGNSWGTENFEKKNNKYYMTKVETVEVESDEDISSEDLESNSESDDLDPKIINFLELISNVKYMNNALRELEIDTEKMPLGKIKNSQINEAYAVLDKINKNLTNKNKLIELSSEFYTLIPISCGRSVPPIINNANLVAKNVNLLNELSQMVFANVVINSKKKNTNGIKNIYDEINTTVIPLEPSDSMYILLEEYLNNSKGSTHFINYKVENMYELFRPQEATAYDEYISTHNIRNKTLLFHGTRVTNMIGILKNGLVVDPSKLGIKVSITGKMFGMGLYFANACTKSIGYCDYENSDNIALLFVAEVALGKSLELVDSDCNLSAETLPDSYHSTHGMGSSSFKEYDEYEDNTKIPSGKLIHMKKNGLLYDEFIVYHEEQIKLRYIIKLKILPR